MYDDLIKSRSLGAHAYVQDILPEWRSMQLAKAPDDPIESHLTSRCAMFTARVLKQAGLKANMKLGLCPDSDQGYHDGSGWHPHAWVVCEGKIIDIRADLHGDGPPIRITTASDPRYRQGEDSTRPRYKKQRRRDVEAIWIGWTLHQAEASGLKHVHSSPTCRVLAHHDPDPSHKTVLLSFTGVKFGMGGVDLGGAEFRGQARRFDNILYLSDMARSWGNHLDFDEITDAISPYIAGRTLHAIGNSMGGSLAILTSIIWDYASVISIVPQFSVKPDILPGGSHNPRFVKKIERWPYPTLAECFNPATRYTILTGDDAFERQHWPNFPLTDNVSTYVYRHDGHALARSLKQAGLLNGILDAAFEDRLSLQSLQQGWPDGVSMAADVLETDRSSS
ncbi:MAG: hypothetical protein Alpg2KO_16440 [Alphaproteobacteria bacterium]